MRDREPPNPPASRGGFSLGGLFRRHSPRENANRYVARPAPRDAGYRGGAPTQQSPYGTRRPVYGHQARRQGEGALYAIGLVVIVVGLLAFFWAGVQWATGSGPVAAGLAEVTRPTAIPSPSPVLPVVVPSPSPSPVEERFYVVQAGDNPASIAQQFRVSTEALLAANNITDPRTLQVGQTLKVPPPGTR